MYRSLRRFILPTIFTLRYSSSDTIFALSSGHGKCGVAVIRVSGSASRTALKRVTAFAADLPKPRTAYLKNIKHPSTSEILDKGLVLWFPSPKSFTGEDSFELHVHGGVAVVNAVLEALRTIPKLRLAEPGEFTRRAFYNGKLDLTEVEGLADLLKAETEVQRKQAFLQSQGSLSKLYNKWKVCLTRCVAHIEALIDFEETETIELDLIETVVQDVKELINFINRHLSDGRKGEILRYGVRTVILGEPNAGKSSLLNVLCQRPAAIVTPIEGTTRDVLEVTLNVCGYPLVLADTAGLRSETKDVIEKEGINRALELYTKSDLILLVVDATKNVHQTKSFSSYIVSYIESLNLSSLLKSKASPDLFNKPCVIVLNKCDLCEEKIQVDLENVVQVSCKTEEGVSVLVDSIYQQLKNLCAEPSEEYPSLNQIRHRQHLSNCLSCLESFLKEIHESESCDLVITAEYLRKSLRHLGKLVGTVTTEHLLDVIFNDFCIGK